MSIACVAIIGKDQCPLYLRTFVARNPSSSSSPSSLPFRPTSLDPAADGPLSWNGDQALHFHTMAHQALDAIEDKAAKTRKMGATLPGDLYLGLLFGIEEYKVYGYMTNSKVKLVAILQDCTQEVNMKQWFRDLHTLYLSTVCNPFADLSAPILNPTFEQNVHKLVKNWFYVDRK